MSEGMMSGTVNVPKVGKVKKSYLYVAVGGTALFVGWRWMQARNATVDDTTYTTSDVGEGIDASGVIGAGGVSGNTQYGGSTTDGTSADVIDTQAEWTQKAVELLSNAGMDPATVSLALGDFLASKPLTEAEAAIARAAMAQAGPVPGGNPAIIPQVGSVTLGAPQNVRVSEVGNDYVVLSFDRVTSAGYYRAYRSGASTNVGAGDGPPLRVAGLTPNTKYTFYVAADTTTGKPGPRSAGVTATTKGATLKAPTGLKTRKAFKTSVQIQWTAVAGAGGYMLNSSTGRTWESTDAADTVTGLAPNKSYRVRVAALQPGTRTPGPWSSWLTIHTTK